MCGVIGYKGFQNAQEVLLKGLEQMEYRGYDSAGVAIADEEGIQKTRAVGRLRQLKNKLAGSSSGGSIGIGHIRWATHGLVVEKNAHPHQAGDIYLVHNGVIENTQELSQSIGDPLLSETDSEVAAHYLALCLKQHKSLKKAVLALMKKLKGEYAMVVLSAKHPGELVAFKKGPSLAVGLGKREVFIASDVQAFATYTRQVVFLKDKEAVYIKGVAGRPGDICFYSAAHADIQKPVHTLKIPKESETRGDYPHEMLKEIYEEPKALLRLIQTHIQSDRKVVDLAVRGDANILDRIIKSGALKIAACGSSYYAALYGKYIMEQIAHIPVEVEVASEFRYRPAAVFSGTHVLISQSGETADTLAALSRVKEQAASPILSICNAEGSAMERRSSAVLDMQAGREKSVASTKAFSSTLVLLFLLAIALGRKSHRLDSAKEKQWTYALLAMASKIEEALSYNDIFLSAAKELKAFSGFIYLGRGVYYPLALEGALKMKELVYRHAEGYPAGEMKHGPLALVDKQTAVIVLTPPPGNALHGKVVTNMEEVRARGGRLFVIGTENDSVSQRVASRFIPTPLCNAELHPVLSAVPLQLMAYHTACLLGHDVDHPRNLAKSVTVE